jgi:hypothetical protein
VTPRIPVTGEVYDEIQLDGLYLRGGWCVLVASMRGKVIGWQWCDREKTVAWSALLKRVPAPRVVVCDGNGGLVGAIAACWPASKVQRCLVHVQRNLRTYLTSKPRTDAGKALWALGKSLTKVTTPGQADAWLGKLNTWYGLYGELTKARTYLAQVTDGSVIPATLKPGQKWWYTHARLRTAYRLLAKLVRREELFTYLRPEFEQLGISSTTNWIEGGVNAGLREMLRRHRGMKTPHQRRAIEWWLFEHAAVEIDPHSLVHPEHHQPRSPKTGPTGDEPAGPALYDTGLSAEEGLWARKGWAGHS